MRSISRNTSNIRKPKTLRHTGAFDVFIISGVGLKLRRTAISKSLCSSVLHVAITDKTNRDNTRNNKVDVTFNKSRINIHFHCITSGLWVL